MPIAACLALLVPIATSWVVGAAAAAHSRRSWWPAISRSPRTAQGHAARPAGRRAAICRSPTGVPHPTGCWQSPRQRPHGRDPHDGNGQRRDDDAARHRRAGDTGWRNRRAEARRHASDVHDGGRASRKAASAGHARIRKGGKIDLKLPVTGSATEPRRIAARHLPGFGRHRSAVTRQRGVSGTCPAAVAGAPASPARTR